VKTPPNCDDKNFTLDKNNRKIFTKRFIHRNDEKITINKDYKSKFSHVITLNSNNLRTKSQQQTQQSPQYKQPQTKYYNNSLQQSLQIQ
jgi:hypothetical protein